MRETKDEKASTQRERGRERETVGLEVDRDTWAWIRRSVVRDDRAVRWGGVEIVCGGGTERGTEGGASCC